MTKLLLALPKCPREGSVRALRDPEPVAGVDKDLHMEQSRSDFWFWRWVWSGVEVALWLGSELLMTTVVRRCSRAVYLQGSDPLNLIFGRKRLTFKCTIWRDILMKLLQVACWLSMQPVIHFSRMWRSKFHRKLQDGILTGCKNVLRVGER